MNWSDLKAEDRLPACSNGPPVTVRARRLTAGQIHRTATRMALLRRGMCPGSPVWRDFFPARKADWSDVSINDLRLILERPDKYIPTPGSPLEVLARDVRFRDPERRGRVHHVNKINLAYGTLISGTGGISSLGTSSTWLAGYEWYVVDNTAAADAGLQLDWFHAGDVMVGTTPTASTEIRHYLVGSPDGTYWPDVFDGTASAETVTSAGVFTGFGKLAAVSQCDATTSDRAYPFAFGARKWFDGTVPKKYVHFVTHNTGVNLNATAGNQKYFAQPEYVTFT